MVFLPFVETSGVVGFKGLLATGSESGACDPLVLSALRMLAVIIVLVCSRLVSEI